MQKLIVFRKNNSQKDFNHEIDSPLGKPKIMRESVLGNIKR